MVAELLASVPGHLSDCPLQIRRGRGKRVQTAGVIRQIEPGLVITHLAEISLLGALICFACSVCQGPCWRRGDSG